MQYVVWDLKRMRAQRLNTGTPRYVRAPEPIDPGHVTTLAPIAHPLVTKEIVLSDNAVTCLDGEGDFRLSVSIPATLQEDRISRIRVTEASVLAEYDPFIDDDSRDYVVYEPAHLDRDEEYDFCVTVSDYDKCDSVTWGGILPYTRHPVDEVDVTNDGQTVDVTLTDMHLLETGAQLMRGAPVRIMLTGVLDGALSDILFYSVEVIDATTLRLTDVRNEYDRTRLATLAGSVFIRTRVDEPAYLEATPITTPYDLSRAFNAAQQNIVVIAQTVCGESLEVDNFVAVRKPRMALCFDDRLQKAYIELSLGYQERESRIELDIKSEPLRRLFGVGTQRKFTIIDCHDGDTRINFNRPVLSPTVLAAPAPQTTNVGEFLTRFEMSTRPLFIEDGFGFTVQFGTDSATFEIGTDDTYRAGYYFADQIADAIQDRIDSNADTAGLFEFKWCGSSWVLRTIGDLPFRFTLLNDSYIEPNLYCSMRS